MRSRPGLWLIPMLLVAIWMLWSGDGSGTGVLKPSSGLAPVAAARQQLILSQKNAALATARSLQIAAEAYLAQVHDQGSSVTCPPSLGTLADRDWIPRAMLRDPWGQGYSVYCVLGAERADIEVRSPGPDGIGNTADDVVAVPLGPR